MRFPRVCFAIVLVVALGSCESFTSFDSQEDLRRSAPRDYSSQVSPDNPTRVVPVESYRAGPPRNRAVSVPASISEKLRNDPPGGLSALVKYLTEGIDDPFEKARILHDWVALNIAYDSAGLLSGHIPAQGFASVIASGKAVCDGYSTVYQALCESAGLPCQKVSGWACVGEDSDIFSTVKLDETNHAWNAVLLKGAWYLVDTTWDAGQVLEGKWQRNFVTGWFLCEPEAMVWRHLPQNPIWQLKPTETTAEEFARIPLFEEGYFDEFGNAPLELNRVNRVGGVVTFTLPAARDAARVSYALWNYPMKTGKNRDVPDCIWRERKGSLESITVAFPNPGKYMFSVCLAEKGDESGVSGSNSGTMIARLGFEATDSGLLNFPTLYPSPCEFRLLEPLSSPLLANTKYRFRFALSKTASLEAYTNDYVEHHFCTFTSVVRGDMYEFEVTTPPGGFLSVAAKTADSSVPQFLVQFGITTAGPAKSRKEVDVAAIPLPGSYVVEDHFECSFTSARKLAINCELAQTTSSGVYLSNSDRMIVAEVGKEQHLSLYFPGAGEFDVRVTANADGYEQELNYHFTSRKGTTLNDFFTIAVNRFLETDDADGLYRMSRAQPYREDLKGKWKGDTWYLWGPIFDSPIREQRNLLQLASVEGKAKIAALCLACEADPNKCDENGLTPLAMGVQAGHQDIVRLLLAKGADPNTRDRSGKTTLDYAKAGKDATILALIREAVKK